MVGCFEHTNAPLDFTISWLTIDLLASEDDVPFAELGFRLLGWLFG